MSLVRKFRRLSWRQCALAGEAAITLGIARAAILLIPFRYLALWLGEKMVAPPPPDLTEAQLRNIKAIRQAVERAARHVPWNAVCLPQAIAAKAMLKRRGIVSTIYFGTALNEQKFEAHAWLTVGEVGVTGMAVRPRYTPIAYFT